MHCKAVLSFVLPARGLVCHGPLFPQGAHKSRLHLEKTKNTLLQAQRALEAKNTPQRISRRMVLPIFVVFLLDANAIDRRLTAT
jgi:hypothetical protein